MGPFDWKPEYSVNVSKFDQQHKRILLLAGNLQAAFSAGRKRDSLSRLLRDFFTYTALHFADEEECLARHSYPELEHHRFEHAQLILKLTAAQNSSDFGEADSGAELMEFLRRWLVNHFLQTDARFGDYLNKLGVY
ncbi:MAG TPA: bacteriohemerythrin [Terriglobales bacterium]|nr:bacteriohemerythrin [Terriglobales bacterium]